MTNLTNTTSVSFSYEDMPEWQEATPAVAWGTITLFFSVLAGYAIVILSVLGGYLPHLAAVPICAYFAYACFTVLHDAGHGGVIEMGSRLKPFEDVMGWIASIPFIVVPYRFFQKIHDRHHAFTNDPDRDPDHYPFGDRWYQVALGCLWLPFEYYRLAFTQYRNVAVIRGTWKSSVVYLGVVSASIYALTIAGFGRELVYLLVLPAVIAVFALVLFFDYLPHHPRTSRGRYQDTRIYPSKLLNMILLGQNYHLIHHLYPRVPWYKYQGLYQRILPELEKQGAPIEDVVFNDTGRPKFLESKRASSLINNGSAVFHLLPVVAKQRFGDDAVMLRFELPDDEQLKFRPGQYLTLSKWLDGRYVSRCYSICSRPEDSFLEIGVRAVKQGVMSSYLVNDIKVGDAIIVEGPHGAFTLNEAKNNNDHLMMVSGGSGITPVLSMLRCALESDERDSDVRSAQSIHFVHAARSIESMMFRDDILQLANKFPEQLKVSLFFSRENSHVLDELLESTPENVSAFSGRLDGLRITELFEPRRISALYVCGPDSMQLEVLRQAGLKGLNSKDIHSETFAQKEELPQGRTHQVEVAVLGEHHDLAVAENQTLLNVALSQNVEMSYACRSGTCGSCKCKVVEGVFDRHHAGASGITEREQDEGYRLACQARPLSDAKVQAI